MANNTLKSINKVGALLATAVGGTGATIATEAVASGTGDTGTLIVGILTSLTSIIYGFLGLFKKTDKKSGSYFFFKSSIVTFGTLRLKG